MHFKSLPKDDPITQSLPKQLSSSHFGKALLIGPLNADRNNCI